MSNYNALEKYIHKDILIFDRRLYPHFNPSSIYSHGSSVFLHEVHYFTDLPKIFELGNAIDSNIYHIFFYMIARLYYIDDGIHDVIFYYPKTDNYIIESVIENLPSRFKRLSVKDKSYEYIEFPGCKWYFDTIEEEWIYSYVKNLFKPIWSNVSKQKKRIYISRSYAQSRKVLNEELLIPHLKKLGFSIYHLENLTFIDQIQLFASSEFIIAPHGAGLSHIIFSQNAVILEINSMKITDKTSDGKNHYYDIAMKMKFLYYRFTDFTKENNNYTININNMIHVINLLIIKHGLQ
jgi:hypothetical protein